MIALIKQHLSSGLFFSLIEIKKTLLSFKLGQI